MSALPQPWHQFERQAEIEIVDPDETRPGTRLAAMLTIGALIVLLLGGLVLCSLLYDPTGSVRHAISKTRVDLPWYAWGNWLYDFLYR